MLGNEASFAPAKGPILVALSGGVDSAVAAWQLREAGFEVAAAYIRTWMNEDELGECPAEEDIRDGEAVARYLGIDFEVINLVGAYRERVVSYLVEGYRRGLTPNPDVMCNREMKFGVFLDRAREMGFESVATGHHCRKVLEAGSFQLMEGADPEKDQSYFLSMITGEQLAGARFPIGHLEKKEVRRIAAAAGLPNAEKKDSQGICFLGKVNIQKFLADYIPEAPGEIVNENGDLLGAHGGLHNFTIGQRKGIGIPSNTDHEFYVVVAKDYATNRLVVEFDSNRESVLYTNEAFVSQISWLGEPPGAGRQLSGRVRYRDGRTPLHLAMEGEDWARVTFDVRQRGLASGQILALYEGMHLLGGATFA